MNFDLLKRLCETPGVPGREEPIRKLIIEEMHSLVDETGCYITIADDGIGLPDGVSWPKPGKLGAAIAQSLRQNAGATLTVKSKPGAGTEVILFFARRAAAPAGDQSQRQS